MPKTAAEENRDRAGWALTALEAYATATGRASMFDGTPTIPDDILCEVAGDLIGDLYHLARLNDVEPETIEERGHSCFLEEVDEEA